MKIILLSFIICLNSSLAFTNSSKIDNTEKRISNLEQYIHEVSKTNDSLVSGNNKISEEVNYRRDLLEDYDRLNSTTFNIISGLFAFFGLIVPIIGYLFVVMPAREQLKDAKEATKEAQEKLKEAQVLLDDVKNNMEELFADFTIKNRDNLIDNALQNIENNNISQKANAINCLDTYKHDGFNEKQIMRMIILIKKDIRPDFFMPLLSFTESIFSTDFLHEYLKKNPLNNLSTWSSIYAAIFNKEEFLDDIAEYIIQSKKITGIFASTKSSSHSYWVKIINNNRLVNNIDNETLIDHMSYYDKFNENETSLERTDRQNSLLYKKYLEVKID